MAMLIFYALTYTKIYYCLTRHLKVDTILGYGFIYFEAYRLYLS